MRFSEGEKGILQTEDKKKDGRFLRKNNATQETIQKHL